MPTLVRMDRKKWIIAGSPYKAFCLAPMTACVLELPMHPEKVPIWDLGAPKRVALEIEVHLEHVFFSLIQDVISQGSPQAESHLERQWTIVDKSSHMLYQG